ncbi:hypothetical protein QQF64_005230 [Cirrhinus molitorella]|uniref:Uncharacterized protein n=1 Tax=Cirrhinus molitorella TaxID=172907 RepID=A0ABR3MIH6_9TELE
MKPDWTRSAPVVLPLMADVSQRVYELILLQEPRQADKASHSAEKLHHHHRRAKKIRTEPAPVTGPSAAGSAGNVRVCARAPQEEETRECLCSSLPLLLFLTLAFTSQSLTHTHTVLHQGGV